MTAKEFQQLLNRYLSGEASPEEEQLLLEWYDSFGREVPDPAHVPDREDQEEVYARVLEGMQRPVRRLWLYMGVAASLLFLLAAAGWYFYYPGRHTAAMIASVHVLMTARGEKKEFVLPDSSRVWLNGDSKLSFQDHSTEITLSGEAFFEVRHHASSPFIVHTEQADIRVLGTAFDVKSYPLEKVAEVVLSEGAVQVELRAKKTLYLLHPHQRLTASGDSVAVQTAEEGKGWKEGRLQFANERFDDLAIELERWFNVKILFRNQGIRNYRFTGTLDNAGLDDVLEALMLSRSFHYQKEGDTIVVY